LLDVVPQSCGIHYVIEATRTPLQISDIVSAISRDQGLGLHLKSRVYHCAETSWRYNTRHSTTWSYH
jgi:hypothetical protein